MLAESQPVAGSHPETWDYSSLSTPGSGGQGAASAHCGRSRGGRERGVGGRVSGEDKASLVAESRWHRPEGHHPSQTMWVYHRPLPSVAQDRTPLPGPQAQDLRGVSPPPAVISLGRLPIGLANASPIQEC